MPDMDFSALAQLLYKDNVNLQQQVEELTRHVGPGRTIRRN